MCAKVQGYACARGCVVLLVCLSWSVGAAAQAALPDPRPIDPAAEIQVAHCRLLPPDPETDVPRGGCPKTGQLSFVSQESLERWGATQIAAFGAPWPGLVADPLDPSGRQVLSLSAPGPEADSSLTLWLKYTPTAGETEYRFPEEWLCLRVLLARGEAPMQSPDEALEFLQLLGDYASSVVALGIGQDDRLLVRGSAIPAQLSETVLPVGSWFEVLVHWRAAVDEQEGIAEIWVDGEPVADLQLSHLDRRGLAKIRLCAINVGRDEPCASHVQWIAWGEVPEHAVYRQGLVLAQNRDVSQQEAAVLLHFHPAERSVDWLEEPVLALVRYVEGEWPLDDVTGVLETDPVALEAEDFYAASCRLTDLNPGTEYSYKVRLFPAGAPNDAYEPDEVYQVRTLPDRPETVKFGWVVCHDQAGLSHPYGAYKFLAERGMDFIVHLGDYIYNDHGMSDSAPATTSLGYLVEYRTAADDRYMPDFTQRRGLFMMWDDHEVWDAWNESWQDPNNNTPSEPDPNLTRYDLYREAKQAFNVWAGDGCLNLSVPGTADLDYLDREYYRSWETARCKFILLDTRSHQNAGANSMIGAVQRAWLFDELAANTKPFVFLLSPSTWGDVVTIFDNWHFGPFRAERNAIETFFQNQTRRGRLFILTGDRHTSFVHTRFANSRIVCEADACPASMRAWPYDQSVADWPGVLFISVDGADLSIPEWTHLCGGVEVNELTGEVELCIIDAETGQDLFARTFEIPLCVEDLNADGVIGQQDLGLLLASYLTDAGGDVDGDGDTDHADLGLLLASYGDACP